MEKVVVMHQVVMDRVDPMGVTGVDPAGEGKRMEEAMVLVTHLVAMGREDQAVPKANLGETVEGVVKMIWMPSEKSFRYS